MVAGQRAYAGRRGKGIGCKKENVAGAFIQKILVGERRSSGGWLPVLSTTSTASRINV